MEPEKCYKLKKRNYARCISRNGHTLEIKEKHIANNFDESFERRISTRAAHTRCHRSVICLWLAGCLFGFKWPFTKVWERQDLSLDNVHLIYFQWKASKKDLARKTIKASDDAKVYFRVDLCAFLQLPIFPFLSLFGPIWLLCTQQYLHLCLYLCSLSWAC